VVNLAPATVKVFIAEDQLIHRAGLQMMLNAMPDCFLVGQAQNGKDAIKMIPAVSPDLLITDIGLPDIDGIEITAALKASNPSLVVLIFTSRDSDADILAAIGAGANGYCLKSDSNMQLARAIRAVTAGKLWLHPGAAKTLLKEFNSAKKEVSSNTHPGLSFSDEELCILRMLTDGDDSKAISDSLVVGENVVNSHMHSIRDKIIAYTAGASQPAIK
jgi:DNA-binding NarL/FixJ family response regulator